MFHSVIPDDKYLNEFLTYNNFGSIDNLLRIQLFDSVKINTFCEQLFTNSLVIQCESGYPIYISRWFRFKKYERSFKIPVATLEPFIALLVKSFSSIGISTYSSCNGFSDTGFNIDAIHIAFIGPYSSLWAKNLFTHFVEAIIPLKIISYKFDYFSVSINVKNTSSIEDIFIEIHRTALAIYNNRIQFIALKKDFCEQYNREIKKLDRKIFAHHICDPKQLEIIDTYMNEFLLTQISNAKKGESIAITPLTY
ncbi:MAG: hypothetical protein N3F66_05665 [Spirochaetes bacterium]|nr:hypothetical protein [Spirochaetota bacterium]